MKKYFSFHLLLVLLWLLFLNTIRENKKKAVQYYNQAQERAADDNMISAIGLLLQAVGEDNKYVDAHLALGSLFGNMKNHKKSIQHFEIAFR